MLTAQTIKMEEIELDHFGFPGVMVMECEVECDVDYSGDWFIDRVYLGGKRTLPDFEKAIIAAIYSSERKSDYIRDTMKGE